MRPQKVSDQIARAGLAAHEAFHSLCTGEKTQEGFLGTYVPEESWSPWCHGGGQQVAPGSSIHRSSSSPGLERSTGSGMEWLGGVGCTVVPDCLLTPVSRTLCLFLTR